MEDQFLLFENYLAGELSGEDLINFENSLQSDIEFKEAFEQYKEVHNSIEHTFKNKKDELNFRNNLEKISANYFKKNTSKNNRWYYSIAASVAILLSVYFFYPSSNPSYEEYREYPSVNFTVRGNENNKLIEGQNAFNNKDFEKSITIFSEVLKEDKENTELKLYKGFALTETNQFTKADIILNSIIKGNSSYKYTATWYLALSKLKQNKYVECRLLLEKLPEEFNQYQKAKKLLRKLPK